MNHLRGRILTFANSNLTNTALVNKINQKVKDAIQDDKPEASTNNHVGVKYIVDFPKLLLDEFYADWEKMAKDCYDEGNLIYGARIQELMTGFENLIKFIIKQMQNLVDFIPELM